MYFKTATRTFVTSDVPSGRHGNLFFGRKSADFHFPPRHFPVVSFASRRESRTTAIYIPSEKVFSFFSFLTAVEVAESGMICCPGSDRAGAFLGNYAFCRFGPVPAGIGETDFIFNLLRLSSCRYLWTVKKKSREGKYFFNELFIPLLRFANVYNIFFPPPVFRNV